MKNLNKALDIVLIPRLVLLKDMSFQEGYREDPLFNSGQFIAYSENLPELQHQIPKPEFPSDPEQVELFKFKFGDVNPESGYFTDLPSDHYDDNPDFKIFNTSYTIIWLVPADVDRTVASLAKRVSEGFTEEEAIETYLDRMVVYPADSIKDINDPRIELGFRFVVQEEFSQKVNGL
ncbi:MAG: hypothetical protein O2887_18020 [Bacteroidetes bacterium]|nr:hypothetical protein [Bacteroidota bacterium]MDA1122353.1 hypothetical protein [Bacteroidota bacterium]